MRILYVEDNMANVALVRRVARTHELVNYIDGQEALNKFDTDAPDLVLMDIQLAGGLTGLDVVKALRARGHKVPIIAVTAYAMVGDRERCLAAGCDGYMAKPLQVPELIKLFTKYETENSTQTIEEQKPDDDEPASDSNEEQAEPPEAPVNDAQTVDSATSTEAAEE